MSPVNKVIYWKKVPDCNTLAYRRVKNGQERESDPDKFSKNLFRNFLLQLELKKRKTVKELGEIVFKMIESFERFSNFEFGKKLYLSMSEMVNSYCSFPVYRSYYNENSVNKVIHGKNSSTRLQYPRLSQG